MKMVKLYGLLAFAFVMPNCYAQSETETTGRIAFAVLSDIFRDDPILNGINLEIILKNQETGETYSRLIDVDTEARHRVEYFDNLVPGHYIIEQNDGFGIFYGRLKTTVEFDIKPGQTTLAPLFIHLFAHVYPGGGLVTIDNEKFWDDYIVSQ